MISEKTLRKWRRDSLVILSTTFQGESTVPVGPVNKEHYIELNERIIRLTQELMDHHLIRR
jgi:hypothetical protein